MLSLQRAQFIVMFPFYSFCSSVVVHSHSCRELFSSFLPGNSHCCRCFGVHRRCCAVRRSNTLNCCCSCYSSTLPPFSSLAHSCSLGAQNKLKTKNSFNWCFGFTQTQFLALVCLHCFFTRFWVFNYLLFKFIVVSCIYCCCIRHPWFGGAKECWWKCQFLRSISSPFEELLPPPPFFFSFPCEILVALFYLLVIEKSHFSWLFIKLDWVFHSHYHIPFQIELFILFFVKFKWPRLYKRFDNAVVLLFSQLDSDEKILIVFKIWFFTVIHLPLLAPAKLTLFNHSCAIWYAVLWFNFGNFFTVIALYCCGTGNLCLLFGAQTGVVFALFSSQSFLFLV